MLGTPFIITVPFDLVAFLLNTPTSLHILSKYSPSAVSAKEFKNIYSKNKNLKLFLVGEGPLKDEVKKMIIDNNLENSIIMLGKRQDMNELYQAFDGFVLPSLYEGLPLVGVEAQIAGCKCILSDSITKEVQIRDDVKFISLKDIDLWEKEILNITNDILERKMKDKNKYDIKLNAEELLNIYRIQLTKEK